MNCKFICNILTNIEFELKPELVKFKPEPECKDYDNCLKLEVLE